MTDVQYLTEEGALELRRELDDLKTVKRPQLAAKLKEAIAQGDLSENADYHDAKEQQAFLEGRIKQLEELLRSATIIDYLDEQASGITVGMEVTVQEEGEKPEKYVIVGAAEASPRDGRISNESPLGRALLGKKVGDKIQVDAPSGKIVFKIRAFRRAK